MNLLAGCQKTRAVAICMPVILKHKLVYNTYFTTHSV